MRMREVGENPRERRRALNLSFHYSGVSPPLTELMRKQEILFPLLLWIQPFFSFRSNQVLSLRAERNVCSQVNFGFVCFSERKVRKFDPSRNNLFAQFQSCIFSAELVYLSSLFNDSRSQLIHPLWWKLNGCSGRKERSISTGTLSVLQSHSIHGLLCSHLLSILTGRVWAKELRGKKSCPCCCNGKWHKAPGKNSSSKSGIFPQSKLFVGIPWFHCNGRQEGCCLGGLPLWISLAGKRASKGAKHSLNSLALIH